MGGQPGVVCAPGSVETAMALRVRLVAPLTLLSQAVAAALRSRGVDVEESPRLRGGRRGRAARAGEPGLLLLLDDLSTAESVQRALELISSGRWRVLVLTGRPRGRYWGAMLAAGAAGVMSSSSSLDDVEAALVALAADEPVVPEGDRQQLIGDWAAFLREEREAAVRLTTLSQREVIVLEALRSGASVPQIAQQLEVAETTIRSQVKSVLRKLGVRSQLAAVALVHRQESPLVTGALAAGTPRRGRSRNRSD